LELKIESQHLDIQKIRDQQEKLSKELIIQKSESAEREKFLAAEIERMKSSIIEKPKRLLIIRFKELFTCVKQEHLSLDDIQRLT